MGARAGVLASGVQGGLNHPGTGAQALEVLGLVLILAAVGLVLFLLARRRRRPAKPVRDQWGALAVMGELCPEGWQASLTVYGWGAPTPDDAPAARVPPVELEWRQYSERGEVTVARRAWAASIPDALEMMVEDRRTDLALEQIEQAAERDGRGWSESESP